MYLGNFHTHTTYCDGKNTAEEMVLAAIKKGFTDLGFSGHSYMEFEHSWGMTVDGTEKYINEIKSLKEKYKNKINIYVGTEIDYYSDIDVSLYDFTIGSVHFVKKDNDYLPIDSSAQSLYDSANKYYNGDLIAFCEDYYKLVSDVYDKTKCDIIGHIDLITKFNENDIMFNTSDSRYIKSWKSAVDNLVKEPVIFEINTGAIARGKRVTPYPSVEIAEYITQKGGKLMLNSDCHDYNYLDCYYNEANRDYGKFGIVEFPLK